MRKAARLAVLAIAVVLFFSLGVQTSSQGGYDPSPLEIEVEPSFPNKQYVALDSQAGIDVDVSNLLGNEAEVSIDVNPTNPNNRVIVGHAPSGSTMNTFFTLNGGQTWGLRALGQFPPASDGLPAGLRFDPTVAFDDLGNVYVGYGVNTGNQVTVVVAKSTNGGQTYPQFTQVATTSNIGTLPGNDKWHLATGPDPLIPSQQNVYIAWTQNVLEGGALDQRIVVSGSTDGGATFSAPVIINDASIAGTRSDNIFADPAVGPNGELYVAWHDILASRVLVDVSLDGGATFGTDNVVTTSGTGFKTSIPAQPDRGVFVGPTIDTDRSNSPFNGRLYVTYTDFGPGGVPLVNTEIFVRFSDDSGATWSGAVLVNDDGGTNSQFLPWLDVDQKRGLVTVVWYDARNDPNNRMVQVFIGISDTGGVSFQPNILVSDGQSDQSLNNPTRFFPNNYLEYIGIATYDLVGYPVWSDNSLNPADLDYFTDQVSLGTLTITEDTDLTENHVGEILIAADDITLDCAKFAVIGFGGGIGIRLTLRTGVIVKNCVVTNFETGIRLSESDKNTFTGNTANLNVVGFVLDGSDGNDFTGNHANHNMGSLLSAGFSLSFSHGNTFTRNRASFDRDGFLLLGHSDGNTFMGNTASRNNGDGFSLFSSGGNTFTGNTASRNIREGFDLAGSNGNTFTGNTATDNFGTGFELGSSLSNDFTGNTASSNDGAGFFVLSSFGNTFTGNTAIVNSFDGFRLRFGGGNTFTRNAASFNAGNGFDLDASDGNTFTGFNTAIGNGVGFSIQSSSGNTIFHNNIIDNGIQASDPNPADNDWHHPVSLEGNFWSDYAGVDDGSGTGKHAILLDGIGDTLMPHPGPDFDNFPFVAPIDDGFPDQVLEGNRISLLQLLITGQTLLSIPSTEASYVAHGFALCLVDTPISTALSPEQQRIFVDARLYRFELSVDGSQIPLTQALRFSEDAQCPLRLTTLFFAQFSAGEFLGPHTFTGTFLEDENFDGVVDPTPALTITVTVDFEFEAAILGGELLTVGATVQPGTQQFSFASDWGGSDVVMTLMTPSREVIDRDNVPPGVTHELGPTSEAYTVTNPEAGEWTIELFGADVPAEGEVVTLTVSGATIEARMEVLGAALQQIVETNSGLPLADKVEDAVAKLRTASNELAKTPPDIQSALGNIEGAVGDLIAAVNDGLLPVDAGISLMDGFAGIARQLAADALEAANACDPGNPDLVDAQASFAAGKALQASALAGAYADFKDAVKAYKDALSKAEGVLSGC